MSGTILSLIFLVCFSMPGLANDNYKYRVWVKDASHLRLLYQENPWMKKFHGSGLYQGLTLRLAPLLFALGENHENAWQGRLIDFIFDKALSGHPMSLTYFGGGHRISPFGITLYGVSNVEQETLSALLKFFKSGETAKQGEGEKQISIMPFNFRSNKLAIAFHQECVSISRDPKIAINLAREVCAGFAPAGDAQVTIRTKEFFSPFYPLLKNFVGVLGDINFSFKWEEDGHRFIPDETDIPLASKTILSESKLPEKILQTIPADASLWALASMADFRPLDLSSLKKYFSLTGKATTKKKTQVLLVFLGMGEKGESKTAIVFPYEKASPENLQQITEVFCETGQYEVKFKMVCNEYLALSPSLEALNQIEASCLKKTPSFRQWSDNYNSQLIKDSVVAASFVHLGQLAAQSLSLGSPKEIQETDEYKQSRELLLELPNYLWVGMIKSEKLTLKGIK